MEADQDRGHLTSKLGNKRAFKTLETYSEALPESSSCLLHTPYDQMYCQPERSMEQCVTARNE